ncbi:penicillin-binding protein 1A [Paraglaciecola mesophila]|uniref:Penicillin-binding protein 1A n=2 Tax=Paraglaciecola mesophila TaxID=197222 RepID=K6Z0R6_9ALTE|nr:penicillin-binding protein 1A [Paraglaciecola mesophila]GAC22588.1 penicillin-binding protein 1A [Paraglaciecola mesophila KMM 241]
MKFLKPAFLILILAFVVGVVTTFALYFYMKPDLPSVDMLKDVRLQTPMRVYTQDGKLISQFGVKRRIPLTIEDVPQDLINAVLATEDSRFYQHPGVDPIGMARAVVNLILTGEKGQGGSTLTMQLARGFFLTRDKTYIRKIKEIFIAWHMEQLLTKQEILELYLNKVELGHRAFGFGAAAQVYYGKTVNQLTLAQMATIAGLPQAPSVLNPISRPDRSKVRRRVVLLRMLDEKYITQAQFDEAVNAPITAKKHGAEIEFSAPYLADLIWNEMVELYGKEEAETGGYQVYATVPSSTQLAAQQAVQRNLHDYDERHGYRGVEQQLWVPVDLPVKPEETAGVETGPAISSEPWDEEKMLSFLEEYQTFESMQPAIVAKVNDKDITIFTRAGRYSVIDWDGLDWARKYITDTRQGNEPEKASDIVSEGSLILIRQREDDKHWQLTQYPDASSAFIALNPHNGAAQAVIGGYSFYQSQFNRATQAKRQVGSNIKPFIYSSALANGFTLASIINDAPINQWERGTGNAWRPENSPPEYDGPIRLRVALGKSKNVVSVRLVRAVGLEKVRQHLSRFGFDLSEIPKDETVSLGSGSHTPLEVATALSVIANGGFLIQPHFVERIEDDYGKVLWKSNPVQACDPCGDADENVAETEPEQMMDIEAMLAAELGSGQFGQSEAMSAQSSDSADAPTPIRSAPRVLDEDNAFLVAEMMRTAVKTNGNWNKKTYWQGTGWRASNLLQRADIAGKTGTTNDSKDTWFSGFTNDLVATVWVGFDDMSRSLGRASRNQNLVNKNPQKFNFIGNAMIGGEDGAKAAEPAWIRFMQQALDGVPEKKRAMPTDLVTTRIDLASGKLTQRTDHTSMFEYFMQGTAPTSYVSDSEFVDPAEESSEQSKPLEDIF